MKTPQKPDNLFINYRLRIPTEVYAKLQQIAVREHRSVAGTIFKAIDDYFNQPLYANEELTHGSDYASR